MLRLIIEGHIYYDSLYSTRLCASNGYSQFAVRDKSLHLINVNFSNGLPVLVSISIGSIHVNVHNVLRNSLEGQSDKRTGAQEN